MKKKILGIFRGRIVSPWWVLLIDIFLSANAFFVAFALRLNFQLPAYSVLEFLLAGTWGLFIYILSFLFYGSYRGVIRHSNYNEFKLISLSCFTAFMVLLVSDTLIKVFFINWITIPRLVLVFHFTLTLILSIAFRMFVREFFAFLTKRHTTINTFIYGAGDLGLVTLEAIRSDKDNQYNIIGFIDDNHSKWNLNLNSLQVINWAKFIETKDDYHVEVIILAINGISPMRKREISAECIKYGLKLMVMPSVGAWVNGVSNQKQIRDIRIDDLLGRDEIKLNQRKIFEGLGGKTILVSGAAGSIGSEIVRQLLKFPVKKILMVDVAESALYDLQQELLLSHQDAPFDLVLADITNMQRLRAVFEREKPHIVFNAAAYKHVPLMENNPYEAIRVNIGGTKTIADLSVEFGVEKFVMVSTDKAVNPTNVMGASKRVCEMYIQSLSQEKNVNTAFITTRFGNVLGSNGSVVPLFKRQIEQGGPVTVTHPDITRYFMTIPEACQLVLEAGFMGNGGEIFVFDMGDPIKIDYLAKEMIRLAGLKVGEDIEVIYTGLRPGEKLYEELLASKELTIATHHEKIMIAKVQKLQPSLVYSSVDELLASLKVEGDDYLVYKLKELVPEYVSMNSRFAMENKV